MAPLFFERVKVEVEWAEKKVFGKSQWAPLRPQKTQEPNVSSREFLLLFVPGFVPRTSCTLPEDLITALEEKGAAPEKYLVTGRYYNCCLKFVMSNKKKIFSA